MAQFMIAGLIEKYSLDLIELLYEKKMHLMLSQNVTF